MKAQDTVMGDEEMTRHQFPDGDFEITGLCEAQADISFKVGIREVVEWVMARLNRRDVGGVNPEWALSDRDKQELKEWGIE